MILQVLPSSLTAQNDVSLPWRKSRQKKFQGRNNHQAEMISMKYSFLGKLVLIPTPEIRAFWGDSLTKQQFLR